MWPIVLSLALSFPFQGQAPAQNATSAPAASPSPPGSARSSTDVKFTAGDLAALLKATQSAEKSPDITINVVGKDAFDMPTYDPIVHFVGVDTKDAATIWMMKSPPKTQSSARALLAAMELACMATGFAGSNWKAIYDQVAALDVAQPAGSLNPYAYRLALTRRIQTIIDSYAPR